MNADHRPEHVAVSAAKSWPEDRWAAVAVEGRAQFRDPSDSAESWRTISAGTVLQATFELRTAGEDRVTLVRGGGSIEVEPDSRAEILESDGPGSATRVLQDLGRLIFRVESGADRQFEVETPYLIAGVKGTVFSVDVTSAGTTVSVSEGVVTVFRSGSFVRTVDLRAGQSGTAASSPGADVTVTDAGQPGEGADTEGASEQGG